MKRLFGLLLRGVYISAVAGAGVFLGVYLAQRSPWYKRLLYHRLVSENEEKRVRAATMLVQIRGEEQLLAALRVDLDPARKVAKRALEYLWLNAAGAKPFQQIEAAYELTDKQRYNEALEILDRVVRDYPEFAEAWNQRACVLWRLAKYDQSIADSRRVLALNPRHYGAWQGLGICHLKLGNYEEALREFRKALEFLPHDEPTRAAVRECEEALQREHSKPFHNPVYA